MSVLDKLSSVQGITNDKPNQELAKELSISRNKDDIDIIAENLWNDNKSIQSNCIKVLYELGYIAPELIADYVDEFLRLLNSKNNRLVWGSMIALSTIASIGNFEDNFTLDRRQRVIPLAEDAKTGNRNIPEKIFESFELIKKTMDKGSVITYDAGINTLARAASSGEKYNESFIPYLFECLKTCRSKSIAMYSESIAIAINDSNKRVFLNILESRKAELSSSQLNWVEKVIKKIG